MSTITADRKKKRGIHSLQGKKKARLPFKRKGKNGLVSRAKGKKEGKVFLIRNKKGLNKGSCTDPRRRSIRPTQGEKRGGKGRLYQCFLKKQRRGCQYTLLLERKKGLFYGPPSTLPGGRKKV